MYTYVPYGYNLIDQKPTNSKSLKSNRALYRACQSGKLWYETIIIDFKRLGFQQLYVEPCILIKRYNETVIILAIYVDDVRFFINNEVKAKGLIQQTKYE